MDTPIAPYLHLQLSEGTYLSLQKLLHPLIKWYFYPDTLHLDWAACSEVMQKPGKAAEAAAAASQKQRREKENEIKKTVLTALHLLACVKEILPLLEGSWVNKEQRFLGIAEWA